MTRYRTIVADPPWHYGKRAKDPTHRGRLPYPSMTLDEIRGLPVDEQHSRKPDRFYEMVEQVSPGPYLELFARRRRYGWDVWGNEAPTEAASQAVLGLSA